MMRVTSSRVLVSAPQDTARELVVTFVRRGRIDPETTRNAYNAQKLGGFFMYPLDAKSNNLRIFVINKNVRHVKLQ